MKTKKATKKRAPKILYFILRYDKKVIYNINYSVISIELLVVFVVNNADKIESQF